MATWMNAKTGDTITTNGSTYTVTKNGESITTDVGKWCISGELWVKNDIRSGYYTEFLLKENN
jgi:hypothetical protein